MRKVIKSVVLMLALLTLLLLVLVIDISPLVKSDGNAQVNQADSVQPLIDQLRTSLRSRYQAQTISVSLAQAESLAGFMHRAINQANAKFLFSEEHATLQVTYKVSSVVGDLYINIGTQIDEGQGMLVNKVSLGKLTLPGPFALSVAEFLANQYTSSKVATTAIETVQSIDIQPTKLNISIAPMDALLREFKNIETGGSSQDTRLLKIRIAHYLRLLDGIYVPPARGNADGPSLAYYMQVLMKEAKVLSANSSATLENEAAILALTIYAGSPRFATLVGDLSFAIESIPSARPRPVLRQRGDLSLHFIFSAAIKLMSEKGVSVAVGEFKELMDRGQGGSGYSFVDLAADMSGAHFAALAVDPKTAQALQTVLGQAPDESLFMVDIDGLEEGLSKAEFTQKYTRVDSPEYRKMVNLIEQRVDALAISHATDSKKAEQP